MYALNEQQIDFILNDIKNRGVETEDLQLNLLDHVCCMIECEWTKEDDFHQLYQQTISKFFKRDLKEIEEETILLLTFKNYFAMKTVMIRSGFISVLLLILGSFFKIMHWPGAAVMLVLGIGLLSLLFLPLVFILKTKDKDDPRGKLILGISTLIGLLLCWATLFTAMHWPGGGGKGILWLIPIGISAFILIPLYFFTGIRNPEIRLNTAVTTIMLIGGTGLLFTLLNVRPSRELLEMKMYSYIQSEDLLKKVRHMTAQNENKLATDINQTAEQIKSLILDNTVGQQAIPKDFKDWQFLEERNLGEAFQSGEKGMLLFSHLKDAVTKYNATQSHTVENEIPIENFQLGKLSLYNNYVVLNYVVQLQMYLATNQNKVTAFK